MLRKVYEISYILGCVERCLTHGYCSLALKNQFGHPNDFVMKFMKVCEPSRFSTGVVPVASCAQHLSPTAIALGSSAIVKVSGQNCFRTLCGSLGQICVEPPRGSLEGSTKVAQVSWCLWSSATDPSWAAKRFCGTKGSTKVPARVRQGTTKVLQVSRCLWFSGADPPWAAKRFRLKRFCGRFTKVPPRFQQLRGQIRFGVLKGSVQGSPITSLNLSPSSSSLVCIFPEQR